MSNDDSDHNLIFDPKIIGDRLLKIRKMKGMSQEETAWATGLSARAYADIERGSVNARLDSILKICRVFDITPNDILIKETPPVIDKSSLMTRLECLPPSEYDIALRLLQVYVQSCDR